MYLLKIIRRGAALRRHNRYIAVKISVEIVYHAVAVVVMKCIQNGVDLVQLRPECLRVLRVVVDVIMVNIYIVADAVIISPGGMAAERALLLVCV